MPRFLTTYFRHYRESCADLPRAVWHLAYANLVMRAGMMVVPFLSLYFIESLGYHEESAGWLIGIWGTGCIAGSYLGGSLADHVGSVRIQVLTLCLHGIGLFLLGQCETFASLTVALFTIGAVASAYRPAAGATLSRICNPGERSRAFALQRLAVNAGMAVGPAMGGLLAGYNWAYLFWVDGSACLIAAALILLWFGDLAKIQRTPKASAAATDSRTDAGGTTPTATTDDRSPWRDGPFLLLMLATLATATLMFQWFAAAPVYFKKEYGMEPFAIGMLLGFNPVLIVLFEMILVHRLRNKPPLTWISRGIALIAISCLMLPIDLGIAWAFAAVAVWTLGEMMESPMSDAFVANRAGAARVGRFLGVQHVAYSIAMVIGPIVGMWVLSRFGGDALWIGCGVLGLIGSGLVFLLARASATESTE